MWDQCKEVLIGIFHRENFVHEISEDSNFRKAVQDFMDQINSFTQETLEASAQIAKLEIGTEYLSLYNRE